jgi:hypothetical protein
VTDVDVHARGMDVNARVAFVTILIVVANNHRRIGMIDALETQVPPLQT